MAAIKVSSKHFTGSRNLFGVNGLGAIVRGLAIDIARAKVDITAIGAFVNSTGAPASAATPAVLVDLPMPTGAIDATNAGGAQLAAFNASIGKLVNARSVLAQRVNTALVRMGLPLVAYTDGTIATAGTLPALDLAATAANGATAADYATSLAALVIDKSNHEKLARAFKEVIIALGGVVTSNLTGPYAQDFNMAVVPAAVASATGTGSLSLASATAYLAAAAANFSTMATAWNSITAGDAPLNVVAI